MKAVIAATMLFMSSPGYATETFVYADREEVTDKVCMAYCVEDQGMPAPPYYIDCNQLNKVPENCNIVIKTITKKSLQKAIENLQVITGIRSN